MSRPEFVGGSDPVQAGPPSRISTSFPAKYAGNANMNLCSYELIEFALASAALCLDYQIVRHARLGAGGSVRLGSDSKPPVLIEMKCPRR